jgi:hypothetical protein
VIQPEETKTHGIGNMVEALPEGFCAVHAKGRIVCAPLA